MSGEYEILESGVATNPNGGQLVNGVAIGEGDTTRGMSGKVTKWPAEALKDGVDKLIGVPIVKNHPGTEKTENGLKVDGQPPLESKVGTVTDAKYKEGVGLLWQGRITDDDMAEKVEEGLAEVSPVLAREIKPVEDEEGVYEAQSITAIRDIGLVSRGASESNRIDTGAAAMSAEALASEFEALKEVAGVSFTGTAEGELDESEIPNDDFEDHYLYPGENKSDSTYPVVDADGNLRKGNVDAAWGLGCRGKCPSDETHDEKLMALAGEFENPPEWAAENSGNNDAMGERARDADVWAACSMQVPESAVGNDDPAGASSSGSDTLESETMSENDNESELSDTEREVLRAAEDTEDAIEVLESHARAEDPVIVEQAEYESLTEQVETAKDLYAESLSERWGTEKDKIKENFGLEALREEFETEDGDLDKEALVQQPQTGQPTDEEEGESGVEALEDEELQAAEALYNDYQTTNLGGEALKQDIVETLGVDDFETAEEVLN